MSNVITSEGKTMATIEFKAKVKHVHNFDGTVAYEYIQVPELTRRHCDMNAFRQHPKFGGLANSDLFAGILSRVRSGLVNGGLGLRLDRLPDNVTVNTSGFLALVQVAV